MSKPIYDNRTIVGYASTTKQAEKIIRGLLQNIPKGWKVTAKMRNTSIIDLPEGWVYSVHP
jgi:hypothetical protein